MPRTPIPTYAYVLVVCEHDGRYLLVQERKHGGGYYLPAGGVEVGETFVEAAVRETLEEAAVLVEPTALLALDHHWLPRGGRVSQKLRVILAAEVVGDPTPKQEADHHTLGARWVRPEEIHGLALRDHEVCDWVQLALAGGPRLPITRYRGVGLHRRAVDPELD